MTMQSPTHVHHDADNVCPGGITESRALEGSSSFLRRYNRIKRANDSSYQLHTSPIETTDQNVIPETEAAPKAELRTTDQNPIQETAATQTAGLETHGSQHDSGRQTEEAAAAAKAELELELEATDQNQIRGGRELQHEVMTSLRSGSLDDGAEDGKGKGYTAPCETPRQVFLSWTICYEKSEAPLPGAVYQCLQLLYGHDSFQYVLHRMF